MYDLIIVGGGPAGLSAGIFAGRNGLKTLILDDPQKPSQMSYATVLENYPGIKETTGPKLLEDMREHAKSVGCEYRAQPVLDFSLKKKTKTVKTGDRHYKCKAVIIATGAQHRKAGVPGEDSLLGKGVSYCPTCDAPLFKDKRVFVIGGSNAAALGALQLKDAGARVKIVHRRDKLRAEHVWAKRLKEEKIPVIWDSVLKEIKGKKKVESVVLKNKKTGEKKGLDVDGVFVTIGQVPTTDLAEKAGVKTVKKHIKTDRYRRTNIKGVFTAGDVHQCPCKQVIVAAASGAVAATSAYQYLKESK